MTSGPVMDVAETFEDIKLGMMRPVLEDTAVPRNVLSGWLESDCTGAVVKGAFGKVNEYKISEEPPELGTLFTVEAEA